MIVTVEGVQHVEFINRDTGEVICGEKLHCLSESVEDCAEFTGRRVATIWVGGETIDVSFVVPNQKYKLVYELALGATKAKLVGVEPVKG